MLMTATKHMATSARQTVGENCMFTFIIRESTEFLRALYEFGMQQDRNPMR